MKIFVINLETHPERLAFADEQLKRLGLAYERLPAVMGKALSKQEMRQAWAKFHSWCVMGRLIQPGEIGCALSHQQIYQRMVAEQIPLALILEDDGLLGERLPEALKAAEAFLEPERSQVLLLTHHAKGAPPPAGISASGGDEMFAEGYVITREGARQLLKANTPIVSVADAWRRWVKRGFIALYKYSPAVVTQAWETFKGSETCPVRPPNPAEFALPRRLLHKGLRLFGVVYDTLLWRLLRR